MTLNITSLVKKSADLELLHPESGESLGVTLRLQSMTNHNLRKKFLEAHSWVQSARSYSESDPKKFADYIIKADKIAGEVASEVVIGWDNDEFMGGEFSPAYAKELLTKDELGWVRDQIATYIQDQQHWFSKDTRVAK